MVKIEIKKDKCIACGACVNVCPAKIYGIVDDKSKVVGKEDDCILCRACENTCPVGAIKISE